MLVMFAVEDSPNSAWDKPRAPRAPDNPPKVTGGWHSILVESTALPEVSLIVTWIARNLRIGAQTVHR